MATTPNMGLLLPIPTVTLGPTYATENNTAFTTVDGHDHTLGKGLPVPTAGLNINADLPFNGYNAITLRSTRFASQSAVLSSPSDIVCLYSVNGNLFYNNQLGQPVQITSGAAIDASTIGGFGGDYATSTALAFYTSSDQTFTFWSNTNTPASIVGGPLTFSQNTLNAFGITFVPNSSIAADYQITWPAALPTSPAGITIDTSGNIGYGGGIVPSGAVIMYGGVSAPTGYLLCDGTSYLISSHPALAAALYDSSTGTYAYGAADGTHFNVPDMRGMFPRGVDNGAGRDPDSASRGFTYTGQNTGDNVGSYQASAVQNHNHQVALFNDSAASDEFKNSGGTNTGTGATSGVFTGAPFNPNVSTGETRGINLYFNFIIKT